MSLSRSASTLQTWFVPAHKLTHVSLSGYFCMQCYEQSISAVCQLDWPRERILIQVLDDSSDEEVQLLIEGEVAKWQQKGINIIYRHRTDRTGFKAGNMKSGMEEEYVKDYEFVTIFDADFQPNSDFLKLTIPHFKVNLQSGPDSVLFTSNCTNSYRDGSAMS